MVKKLLLALMISGLFLVPQAMAGEDGPGCGLGKVIWKGKSGFFAHTSAASTNGWSLSKYIGLSLGTSGCKSDSVILTEREQAAFVALNMDNLNQDMAQGEGQYVDSLASLMGCSAGTYGEFAQMTQDNFETLSASSQMGAGTLLVDLKKEIAAKPGLSSACTIGS